MSNRKDHIDKARHNERFFSSFDIDTTPFLDWVVNGIFYSALQYLDCYLANQNKHPGNHSVRNSEIRADPVGLGRSFFKHYMHLKDDSEEGRYSMRVFVPDEVRNDILPLLSKIKTHLKKYIHDI